MQDEAVDKVFRNTVNGYLAVFLEEALERVVQVGLRFSQGGLKDECLLQALENKAVPVIQGILRTFNPEVIWNVREMEPERIWEIYWALRTDGNEPISIFTVIAELNSSPPTNLCPATT